MHIWQIKLYAGTDTRHQSNKLCSGVVRAASARQAIVFAAEPVVDSDSNLTVELERLPETTDITLDADCRAVWSPRSDGAAIRSPKIEEF